MVQFQHWMYCQDCEVYAELGAFDYERGFFQGPLLPRDYVRTGETSRPGPPPGGDWALRMFLEQHSGHRVGIESDVQLYFEKSPIQPHWRFIEPVDRFCMDWRGSEELMKFIVFPEQIKKVLFIVDVYDWAWHIASQELLQHWTEVEGTVVDIKDFVKNNMSSNDYDVVFVYPWGVKAVMDHLDFRKTVVYVAGGPQVFRQAALTKMTPHFKFFGTKNSYIKKVVEDWFPKRRVVVLTTGIDTDLFKPKPIQHDSFVVGWAGSTVRTIKRFNIAKTVCREANVEMNVAGGLEELSNRPHVDMPYFYNYNDCQLITSSTEAHPLVAYESMACEVPVVTTRVGDVEEVIEDGVSGFIVDVNAPITDFVDRINTLKRDENLRREMGRKARQAVIEHFSWSNIVDIYRELPRIMNDENTLHKREDAI